MTKKYTEAEMQSNELKRIENEENRIENEAERIANEIERIANEEIRNEFYEGFNDRLDAVNSQLEHIENKGHSVNINVLYPPSPLKPLVQNEDSTERLNSIIDYCRNTGKQTTLIFPPGEYKFRSIKLVTGVNMIGYGATLIPTTSNENSFIYLDNGEVQYNIYRGFKILANEQNENQIGLDLTAKEREIPYYDGGIWCCNFKDIVISGFKVNIFLKALDKRGDLANQFLNFEKVNSFVNKNGKALYIEGQLGQTEFNACEFTAPYKDGELLVDLKSTLEVASQMGGGLTFRNCTFQNAVKAIQMYYCYGIKIENSWFENLEKAITLEGNSFLIFDNSTLSNACKTSNDDGNGYGILVSGSTLHFNNSRIMGKCDIGIKGNFANGIKISNSEKVSVINSCRFGTVVDGVLETGNDNHFVVGLNEPAEVKNIKSTIGTNETLTLVSNNNGLTFNTTGNIILPYQKTLTLNANETATFMRMSPENINNDCFYLISTTGIIASQ